MCYKLKCMCVCALSHFSRVWLSVTPGTAACQAPLSMGFLGPEHWSGLPCPPAGDLPNSGIAPGSLTSPVLVGRFFIISTTWEAPQIGITTVCSLEHSITWNLRRSFVPLQDSASFSGWGAQSAVLSSPVSATGAVNRCF